MSHETREYYEELRSRKTEKRKPGSLHPACCAALLEIVGACEQYQNTDFEGMDDDQRADEGYKCSMEVIRLASAALKKCEAQHNEKGQR